MNVVRHVVREIDIRGVVDKAVARTAHNDAAVNRTARAGGVCAAAMEVDRVATPDIGACTWRCREDDSGTRSVTNGVFRELKVEVVERDLLVGPSKLGERRVLHTGIVRVHEHDVPAMSGRRVLGRQLDIASRVGHIDIKVGSRRDVIQCQRLIERDGRAIDRGNRANFVTGRALRPGDDDFVASIPASRNAAELQRCCAGGGMIRQSHTVSRLGSMNFRRPLQDGSATELFRVPVRVDDTVVDEHDLRGNAGCDRVRSRTHLEAAMRRTDNRVDAQLGVDIRRETERAVNANGLEFVRNDRIDRQRHPCGNDNPCAVGWRRSVFPDAWIRPVSRCDHGIRRLIRRDQSHRCGMGMLNVFGCAGCFCVVTLWSCRHHRIAGKQCSDLKSLCVRPASLNPCCRTPSRGPTICEATK